MRYKKTYNSDARRVSWMVNNNLSEDYDTMPVSMQKKWPKAAYKRERFLAKEFVKHLRTKELSEQKLRKYIRGVIKEQLKITENYKSGIDVEVPTKDMGKVKNILKKLNLKPNKNFNIGVGGAFGSGKTFVLKLDKKIQDKVIELLMKNRIKIQ